MEPTLYFHEAALARNTQAISLLDNGFPKKIYKLVIGN